MKSWRHNITSTIRITDLKIQGSVYCIRSLNPVLRIFTAFFFETPAVGNRRSLTFLWRHANCTNLERWTLEAHSSSTPSTLNLLVRVCGDAQPASYSTSEWGCLTGSFNFCVTKTAQSMGLNTLLWQTRCIHFFQTMSSPTMTHRTSNGTTWT